MSFGTSNRDGGKTSESGHLRAIQKVIAGEVLSGLNVSQRAAGVNMSVDIAVGDAVLPRSDGTYGHPAYNDAVYKYSRVWLTCQAWMDRNIHPVCLLYTTYFYQVF